MKNVTEISEYKVVNLGMRDLENDSVDESLVLQGLENHYKFVSFGYGKNSHYAYVAARSGIVNRFRYLGNSVDLSAIPYSHPNCLITDSIKETVKESVNKKVYIAYNVIEKPAWPIYNVVGENELPKGLYLGLFHGFESQEAREENNKNDAGWGENGPCIGPLDYVHTTYASFVHIQFADLFCAEVYGLDTQSDIEMVEGCLSFGGMEYGDWTVFYSDGSKFVAPKN